MTDQLQPPTDDASQGSEAVSAFLTASESLARHKFSQTRIDELRENVSLLYEKLDASVSGFEELIFKTQAEATRLEQEADEARRTYYVARERLPRTDDEQAEYQSARDEIGRLLQSQKDLHAAAMTAERSLAQTISEQQRPNRRPLPTDGEDLAAARCKVVDAQAQTEQVKADLETARQRLSDILFAVSKRYEAKE
ncbi:MAG: hypothetical protein F9B45_29165 [Phycisphaera sp. RhM]|nr:hypothetical protein [Phycisphaera sp. RhM]